jgi:SAM-dependent methyltransferase
MIVSQTIETYNKYAKIYDQEVIEFWESFPKEFIQQFVENLPGKRVLNLGSGSGRDALLLRDTGLEVICFDASQAMVDMTTKLGFESHLATFDELSFPAASFDGVWAYTSLIHIPKTEAKEVIARAHGLLKSQGLFAIGVIEGSAERTVERKTMPDTTRFFKDYTSDELKQLIEPIGFSHMYEDIYKPHNSAYLNQLYRRI